MNAFEKVRYLKVQYNYLPGVGIKSQLCFTKNNWQPEEINELKAKYPWLPQFYINFIQEFDSLGLAWVTFYGSRNTEIISIWDEIEEFKDLIAKGYFPFGKHPSGGVYAFKQAGEVNYFIIDDYDWEDPIFTASSLEIFIDECLLGKRYPEFNIIEDDTFYTFLKDQGWA